MKMKATLKQLDGLSLMAYANTNHWIAMDAPSELGGNGAGSRPMEVMLMGIAGCAAMDIIAILKKKKMDVRNFEVEVDADKADEHPQVFEKIRFKYKVYGKDVKEKDVKRSIELTDEKYCGAIEVIRDKVEIEHDFEIIDVSD